MMKDNRYTRRTFVFGTSIAALGVALPRRARASAGGKLNVAGIGVGGKGHGNMSDVAGENIVALCDVDDQRAAGMYDRFPDAKRYRDFRIMLEKHQNEIDAVVISTPDHTHAPAALMAMLMGKHVYVEKPLTHTIHEARLMRDVARRMGVVTQMGNQGRSGDGVRRVCETIASGEIGPVREVHAWSDRPVWAQDILPPEGSKPVPDHFDWDLWLGPAAARPFNDGYHPFAWRGWWDFGCGALGDMGCHILDPVFAALRLHLVWPTSVECVTRIGGNEHTAPKACVTRYEFPKRGNMPAVTVTWYDGGLRPPHPAGLPKDEPLGEGSNGSLFIGDRGVLSCGTYSGNPRLHPQKRMEDFRWPDPVLPRSIGHHREWVEACKGNGPAPTSNFDYAGPFTEMVLLGHIASKVGGRIEWNGPRMRCTNRREVTAEATKEYRKGWELPV